MSATSRPRRAATTPAARKACTPTIATSSRCYACARRDREASAASSAPPRCPTACLGKRPDLLEALYGAYVFRRMERDAEFGDGALVKQVVIFSRQSGEFSCNVSGGYPRRAVAAGDAVMTQRQSEALDALKRISASPEFYLDMTIGEGDIQFLNNRTILHGRTGYEDSRDVAQRRHLMRLWLQVLSWPD